MEPATCRICYDPEGPGNPLWQPCRCAGSLAYIHRRCLLRWVIEDGKVRERECHLCKAPYTVDAVQRLEEIPGAPDLHTFFLQTPFALIVLSHYYIAFLLWLVPEEERPGHAPEVFRVGHDFVHFTYLILFVFNARTQNLWRYLAHWGQHWYWIVAVHQALRILSCRGYLEAAYMMDMWLSMYWHAHVKTLEKINAGLLGP